MRSTGGEHIFSGSFKVARGVIQGDIISPILFIIALDHLIQQHDGGGKGVRCGRILKLRVFGYADDAALIDNTAEVMTTRLTSLADASLAEADMKVNMSKTVSQHVFRRDDITVTTEEAIAAEAEFKHQCDFCPREFKEVSLDHAT